MGEVVNGTQTLSAFPRADKIDSEQPRAPAPGSFIRDRCPAILHPGFTLPDGISRAGDDTTRSLKAGHQRFTKQQKMK